MKLTDEQEAIVSSQSPSIVVLSVAGSGKTTCIEHRVAKKIQQGESPKRMLVMTFSRNMAKELKQKIPDVDWIGTFHSICKRILDEYGHMVGYPKVVLVEEEGYLLKKAMRMSYVKGSQKKIRLLMREYFLTGNTGMHYGFDFFIELYLRYLKDNQIMTYDLLEFYAKEVLKMGIPLRFTSVFIDEFQDTTPIEMEIVKLLSYDSIMVVGDVMQNLYTFRGTTIDNLLLFDGDRLPLSLSFRCPQPIVDVANGIVSQNTFGYSMELKAVKFGVPVSIKTEIDDIPGIVSMYLHKGFRQKEIAILCATNKQVSIVSELLSGFETALNPNYYLRGLAWDVASAFVGMIRDFYMDYAVTRFALLIKIVDQGNIDFLEKYLKDGERLVDKIGSSIAPYLALATFYRPISCVSYTRCSSFKKDRTAI